MKPIVMAERSVGDHDRAAAACMTPAIAKHPTRLAMSVPYGNAPKPLRGPESGSGSGRRFLQPRRDKSR
jgi:hypothetical protein